MADVRAEVRLATGDLRRDISFFTKVLGFRMDTIYPADDPRVAAFFGCELRLQLDAGAKGDPGKLCILTDDPDGFAEGKLTFAALGGTRNQWSGARFRLELSLPGAFETHIL